MRLHTYFRIMRKHLGLISLATLFCAAGSVVASLATVPVYEGKTKLLVVAKAEPEGGISSAYEGTLLSQQLVKSFALMVESRATAEAALHLDPQPLTPTELQERIHAEPIIDTLLIDVSVQDTDPARAKRLTNNLARAFIRIVPSLQRGSALQVSQVEPALEPTQPIRPRPKLNIALGVAIGLLLGVGIALLREWVDSSIKTPEDLEAAAGAPVFGTIPPFKASRSAIPVADQPRAAAAEAFRKLRTNFAFLGVDRESVCCVVTSPGSGNGKSTVTANLATAIAQAGQRVIIVDADLRKPTQHKLFALNQRVGTTTILLDRADVEDAIQTPSAGGPTILTSGQLPPNPSELLGSRRMLELLDELRRKADVILLDCPPLLPVTDPLVLSRFADGILLVARAGSTSREQIKAAAAACHKVGAEIIGTVLNGSQFAEADQPSYYAYYGEKVLRSAESELAIHLGVGDSRTTKIDATRASRHGGNRTRLGAR